MSSATLEVVLACSSAALAGLCAWMFWAAESQSRQRKQRMRIGAIREEDLRLECNGPAVSIIRMMRSRSQKIAWGTARRLLDPKTEMLLSKSYEKLSMKAGLSSVITRSGYVITRVELSFLAMAIGCVVGVCFSTELGLLLAVFGGVLGWGCVSWALKKESAIRCVHLEGNLSELIEVVALGLRSGLTFDRSFELYHMHFDSGLARSCARTQQQWSLGLATREEALRSFASAYDSTLLVRIVENIIRSLRFGSSLADSLEASALEARSIHKAHVEERVAKAPVKMLVPTGTLILPAMLLFVLGPVLLDLMHGF